MRFPASTGHVAETLGTTEPKINDLIRRGKVNPGPPVFAGRRLWNAEHVLQAAEALGILNDGLAEALRQAELEGSDVH